jgi:hypothetical protein
VVLGFKAHSGWAVLVALGFRKEAAEVVDRRRVDLYEPGSEWVKAPYHAAESLKPAEARRMVDRGVAAAHRNAARALREAVDRLRGAGHLPTACAILTGAPMPPWTTDEILAVHFRMHKAEGVLWRAAIAGAAGRCGLRVVPVAEKRLNEEARAALGATPAGVTRRLAALGDGIGPPWGQDQKDAALAALIALEGPRRS